MKFLQNLIDKVNNTDSELLITFINYSKAFDTVNHQTLINKLVSLKFGNNFINLIIDYLSDRRQFVLIDDKKSKNTNVKFGVPQGSILGPILFNIYVHDLSDKITSSSIQFADDTTIYTSCKPRKLDSCKSLLQQDIDSIGQWSNQSNLLFNAKKTKTMLFSTDEMSRTHDLDKTMLQIASGGKQLERVNSQKLLGVNLSTNLKWNVHVDEVLKATYGTLRTLKQIKRMTPFNLRKNLAEALVLYKIDYAITVYGNHIQHYLQNRIQKVINCTAGYVNNRYTKQIDVVNLKWLPFQERVAFATSKLAQKAIHDPNWPSYLSIQIKRTVRTLRGNNDNENIIVRSKYEKSLNGSMYKHFNELPKNIRVISDNKKFKDDAKTYYLDKALARTLSY